MSEKQAAKLFQGITDIDDDIIEEAQAVPRGAKAPVWRRWGAIAACLCLAVLAGVWRFASTADAPTGSDAFGTLPSAGTDESENGGALNNGQNNLIDGCDTLPGGITPVLRVGGTLYQWTGMSVRLFLDPSGSFSSYGDGSTYLPEGFYEYGALSGVTQETPTEELQLQAGFEASGTVFVSADCPAVAYVRMTTGWFEDAYVRFASNALGGGELLSWQGRMYRISIRWDVCETLEELPEGCELIGNLHFVGDDFIPAGDLETNCRSDSYFKPLQGREVYVLPGDDSILYVYERHYWAQGDYPAWRACHLWEQ